MSNGETNENMKTLESEYNKNGILEKIYTIPLSAKGKDLGWSSSVLIITELTRDGEDSAYVQTREYQWRNENSYHTYRKTVKQS